MLEDGHWADAPTLLLLRHLARAAGNARVLLLATFRDTEADVPEALSETLADLRRSDDVVRLRLAGLSDDDVAEFVRRAAGGDAGAGPPELARAIGELTDGNAFLVCELWRALVETGIVEVADGTIRLTRPLAELGTPESVREVVSQRLSRLAPATTDLLELAATAGPEFELDIVRRAAGLGEPELLAALDEAVRSGMIEELPSRRLAYRFTHELVRRALYDRLSGVRRAELHLRVGEALERAERPLGPRPRRPRAPLRRRRAARRSRSAASSTTSAAARAAAAALAFDEAAARLRTALELGIESPRHARGGLPRARHRQPPRRAMRSTRWRRSGRRRPSPASSATASCSRARRSATRTPAGARGSPTRARSSCSRRRRPRSATRTPSCASGCSAGSRARSTSRASTSAAPSSARTRSRWRGGSTTRAASPPC